jgi:hypothetical protein
MFRPDFLFIPMYSREYRPLSGKQTIRQKRGATRQPWAQWRCPGDNDVLRRDYLCGIDIAHLTPLCCPCWCRCCFVDVLAVAVLVVFIAVWRHRCPRCRPCSRRPPRSPCRRRPCRLRRSTHSPRHNVPRG